MDYNEMLFADRMHERAEGFRRREETDKLNEMKAIYSDPIDVRNAMKEWYANTPGNKFIEMALDEVQRVAAVIKKTAKETDL